VGKFGPTKMKNLVDRLKKSENLVICANDAGGAENLSSFLIANNIIGSLLLQGPASQIFSKKFSNYSDLLIQQIPTSVDILLTGTGNQTEFEFNAMSRVLDSGGEVIAALDHWCNYPERFIRNGNNIRPTAILVFDYEAERLAKKHFPKVTIYKSPNYYFQDIEKSYKELIKGEIVKENQQDFLFLCEPISSDRFIQKKDYNEFDALEYFFRILENLNFQDLRITIRPHPSDPDQKYESSIPVGFRNTVIDYSSSLVENLAKSRVIVGCNTMAMIVALDLGKTVLSATPPPATTFFPHKRITKIQDWKSF
jgi:hypothetical protein